MMGIAIRPYRPSDVDVMLEAIRAFENTDLIRLEVVVAVGNIASRRVAEKAAARREGTLRNRLVLHGRAHDAVMFSFARQVGSR